MNYWIKTGKGSYVATSHISTRFPTVDGCYELWNGHPGERGSTMVAQDCSPKKLRGIAKRLSTPRKPERKQTLTVVNGTRHYLLEEGDATVVV